MEYSDHFVYRGNQLYAEDCSVADLAKKYGTPLYIYSHDSLKQAFLNYDTNLAVPHTICYSVKANSNLAVLQLMASLGSGFDIVSKGELARVVAAGGDPSKVVYSGVGKRDDEIRYALEKGIYCFNAESKMELKTISDVAVSMNLKAPVALRVNPDVDPHTHHHIATGLKTSKFGVAWEDVLNVYEYASSLPGLQIKGVDCHIGSQIASLSPFAEMAEKIRTLAVTLKERYGIEFIDVGGGLGINYDNDGVPATADYMKLLESYFKDLGLRLVLEPGRSVVGNAGILVTRVQYLKQGASNFIIVDAGMNDMIRPALYSAWMNISEVDRSGASSAVKSTVVGPICESSDKLGEDRLLAVKQGDLLVQFSAGAYGFSMSSNYNSRPRAAEVMVKGDRDFEIRTRETVEDLWRGEHLL
jgi:diaminopimelate decarboxylase